MKKLAIVLALMLIPTQVLAAEATNNANVEKKPAQQVQQPQQQASQQKTPSQVQKDEEYLLKYNIRDLEAAPWLHGGKRSYN
jgi:uncharacterized protein YdeI (BOF family)